MGKKDNLICIGNFQIKRLKRDSEKNIIRYKKNTISRIYEYFSMLSLETDLEELRKIETYMNRKIK